MQTITGKEAVGRGRDLEILTVDVVGGTTRTALRAVVCPKEQRARPVDDCVPCVDGTGPVSSPTSEPGFFGCTGREGAIRADASPEQATPATAIMTRGVVAFAADVSVDAARAELLRRGLSGAPVVDGKGHPVGVLTLLELARAAAAGMPATAVVRDVMLRTAIAVADTAPVSEVASVMAAETISLVPVVAREGYVVGVVTALDVVEWMSSRESRGARPLP